MNAHPNFIPNPNVQIGSLSLLSTPIQSLQRYVATLTPGQQRSLLDRLRGLQLQMIGYASSIEEPQPPYDFDQQEDALLAAFARLKQPALVIQDAIEKGDSGPIQEWYGGGRNMNSVTTGFLRINPDKPESMAPLLNDMTRHYDTRIRRIRSDLIKVQRERSMYETAAMKFAQKNKKQEAIRHVLPKVEALIATLERAPTETTGLLQCDPKQKGCLERLKNVFRGRTQRGGAKNRRKSRGHAIRKTRRQRRSHHLL